MAGTEESSPWDWAILGLLVALWLNLMLFPPTDPDHFSFHPNYWTIHQEPFAWVTAALLLATLGLSFWLSRKQLSWGMAAFAVILNLLGLLTTTLVSIPTYVIPGLHDIGLDLVSVGVTIAALLYGPRCAVCTALVVPLVFLPIDPPTTALASGAGISGWCFGKLRQIGGMDSYLNSMLGGLIVGLFSLFHMVSVYTFVFNQDQLDGVSPTVRLLDQFRRYGIGIFTGEGHSYLLSGVIEGVLAFWIAITLLYHRVHGEQPPERQAIPQT